MAVFCAGLVIKDLVFNTVAALFDFGHAVSVSWYALAVVFGL